MGGIVQKIEQKKDYIGPDLCYVAGMPSGAAAATGKLPLTPRQREHLLQALRQATEARLYRRLLALVQIDRGKPVAQVAEELMVSRMTVHRWLRRYLRCRDPCRATQTKLDVAERGLLRQEGGNPGVPAGQIHRQQPVLRSEPLDNRRRCRGQRPRPPMPKMRMKPRSVNRRVASKLIP